MAGTGTEMMVAFRVIPYVPIHDRWMVQVPDSAINKSFRDVQRQGRRHREHTHSLEPKTVGGREGTLVRDAVNYEAGFGVVGSALERLVLQRLVRATFAYRRKALERLFSGPPLAGEARERQGAQLEKERQTGS